MWFLLNPIIWQVTHVPDESLIKVTQRIIQNTVLLLPIKTELTYVQLFILQVTSSLSLIVALPATHWIECVSCVSRFIIHSTHCNPSQGWIVHLTLSLFAVFRPVVNMSALLWTWTLSCEHTIKVAYAAFILQSLSFTFVAHVCARIWQGWKTLQCPCRTKHVHHDLLYLHCVFHCTCNLSRYCELTPFDQRHVAQSASIRLV